MFKEAESIFPVMFGNLIDGSQNVVWRLALKGKILQNYENRSKANIRPKQKLLGLTLALVNG